MDEAVGNVGERVENNGAEERLEAAELVAEQAPEKAAEKHAAHLPVDKPRALGDELIAGEAQALEAGNADNGEKDEVVDIDEVAERADDDRGMDQGGDNVAGGGAAPGRWSGSWSAI